MATLSKNSRTCSSGHRFIKSSNCPTCPICEAAKKSPGDLPKLAAPARRALENFGIKSLAQFAQYSEAEIAQLHGMGPNALGRLMEEMKAKGLVFREK